MPDTPIEDHLSKITTRWDEIFAAHNTEDEQGCLPNVAQQNVLRRYADCVHRYILAATGDHHVAEDLTQDFALRFLRGDYSRARPEKGRFRDYLKTSLRNLITDHFRSQSKKHLKEIYEHLEKNEQQLDSLEEQLMSDWRKQILNLSWNNLKQFEFERNNFFHTVLAFRAKHPKENSDWLAAELSKQIGQSVNSEWVRQKLHRARKKFGSLLIEQVRSTINSEDELEQEIAELKLQQYIAV